MNFKKDSFTTLTNSRTFQNNAEFMQNHIERMENLLESYDIENSYLNQQVTQLLHQKRQIQTKYALLQSRHNSEHNLKYAIEHHIYDLKRMESNYLNEKSPLKKYRFSREKDSTMTTVLNQSNKITPKLQTNTTKNKKNYLQSQFHYLSNDRVQNTSGNGDSNTNKKKKGKQQTQKSQLSRYKNCYNYTGHIDEQSPKPTSRFLKQEELKKDSINQLTSNSTSLGPLIKRDAYIRQPEYHNTDSFNSSPQKLRNISPKLIDSTLSNNSKKSINQILPSKLTISGMKSKLEQLSNKKKQMQFMYEVNGNGKQKQKQNNLMKNQQKQVYSYEVSPIKMSESFIAPENKQQLQYGEFTIKQNPSDGKVYDDDKKNGRQRSKSVNLLTNGYLNLQMRQKFSQPIDKQKLQRNLSIVVETGVNTESHYNNQRPLIQNRSLSQHRILPSEKISYPEKVQQVKKEGERTQLKEGKKRFINIVSNGRNQGYRQLEKDKEKDNSFFK